MHHLPALDDIGRLAVEAGRAILEVYHTDFSVDLKADEFPLTLADIRSHQIIADGLRSAYPDIPVLSEEGKSVPYGVRKDWSRFWRRPAWSFFGEFMRYRGYLILLW